MVGRELFWVRKERRYACKAVSLGVEFADDTVLLTDVSNSLSSDKSAANTVMGHVQIKDYSNDRTKPLPASHAAQSVTLLAVNQ